MLLKRGTENRTEQKTMAPKKKPTYFKYYILYDDYIYHVPRLYDIHLTVGDNTRI